LTADGAGAGSAAAEKHLLRWTWGLAAEQAGTSTAAATDLETVLYDLDDRAALKAKAPAALRKAIFKLARLTAQPSLCKTQHYPAYQIFSI